MSEEPPKGKEPTIRQLMMPKDTNALGTIFGGIILSQIDQAAAIAAHRCHHGGVVTVAMDQVEFKKPVFVGDVVSYYVNITRIGNTSVTVDVSVWAQRQFAEEGVFIPVTEASVTMVAVDDKCHPISLSES